GRIGVSICPNFYSGSPGLFDLGNDLGHASPIWFSGGLEVPYLYWEVALAADANSFVNGRGDGVTFAAHVCGINAAQLSGLSSQRNQFFGGGIRCRRVLEGSREANGSIAHGLAHQLL